MQAFSRINTENTMKKSEIGLILVLYLANCLASSACLRCSSYSRLKEKEACKDTSSRRLWREGPEKPLLSDSVADPRGCYDERGKVKSVFMFYKFITIL